MNRRRFLALVGTGCVSSAAGCSSHDTTDSGATRTRNRTDTRTTNTSTPRTKTANGPDGRTDLFVGPNGDRDATGGESDPLGSIQTAFEYAQPGDTIHALPGDYVEAVRTTRGGQPGNPITLTGPPDAVFRGRPMPEKHKFGFHIEHSHVHIRGLTFNGLWDTARPDSRESYIRTLISARHPPGSPGQYHQDLVIKPHAVGNTLRPLIYVAYSRQVEIGEFEVIGPAGLAMLEFGDEESHNGEVVYLGHAPDQLDDSITAAQFGGEPDQSRDIHVHHIDNSAGHPHAELVDVKAGCSDVLIEYCTDAGGAGRYILPGGDPTSETSMHLGGRNVTLRWNVIEGSHGQGVEVGSYGLAQPEAFEDQYGMAFPEDLLDHGRANEIYGNRIVDCAGLAIQYPTVYTDGTERIVEGYGPGDQTRVCGNSITGESHGQPARACDGEVPTTDTIGHLGGDSPWSASNGE